jgi:hypothetical protein
MADVDGASAGWDVWVQRGSALVVAGVAAYMSYRHQRVFALRGGADEVSAGLWPLSVDGLLVLSTVGLLRSRRDVSRRIQSAAWLSFLLGVVVSLAANIAVAPSLGWQPVLVAGWPPVALLLAVELLVHGARRQGSVLSACRSRVEGGADHEGRVGTVVEAAELSAQPTAEQVMWNYFQAERARGRTPTGAELDRVAGTNNYGRSVIRRWRDAGRMDAL